MTDRHLALVRFITARQTDLRDLREVTFAVLAVSMARLKSTEQTEPRPVEP